MAIKVYILKKSIMKSSMDEYLEMKAELKERKKLEKQMNPEKQMDPESRKIVRKQGYLDRMMHFESKNPKTLEQFGQIREEMQRYLK